MIVQPRLLVGLYGVCKRSDSNLIGFHGGHHQSLIVDPLTRLNMQSEHLD